MSTRANVVSMEEDPLTYFLTPVVHIEDDDDTCFDFDLDAGIHSGKNPRETIRSISPSSLEREMGLWSPENQRKKKYEPQLHQVPLLWGGGSLSSDEDDDEEDYFSFRGGSTLPWELPVHSMSAPVSRITRFRPPLSATDRPLLPLPALGSSPTHARRRSPPANRLALRRASSSGRSSPGHSWREPSPEVWSIEELPDEEEMDHIVAHETSAEKSCSHGGAGDKEAGASVAIDIPAAKPRKQVRFQLPVTEWL